MAKELGIRNASKMAKQILYNEIINKKTEQMNEETKKKTKKK